MNIVKGITNILPVMRHSVIRGYAMRSDLKIKWVRPEHVSPTKPERSGDLSPLPMMDPKQFMHEFKENQELAKADEKVQRLFRLENNPRREMIKIFMEETIGNVQRHELDYGSMEAKIAKMTAKIRSMQDTMEKFPRNKVMKVILKEKIDKRRKFLKYVRRWDYRRYEWLLEKLDLIYKDIPETPLPIHRKDSVRKLTAAHCDDLRQQKLDEYRKKLESQQLDFLERKMKNLQFVRNEQIACQVQVTVSEDDVAQAKARYEEMLAKQKKMKEEEELEIEAH